MSSSQRGLLGSIEVLFLGTLGLGTVIWLNRNQISDKLFKSKSVPEVKPEAANSKAVNKVERNFVKVMQKQGRRVIFFYGSQTGTAEDYASRLAKECSQKYGIQAMTADIEQYDLSYLDTVPEDFLVFFIMATYGEGEPTDNAVDFWEMLGEEQPMFSEGETDGSLKNLRYIAFGLGNKTYEHYNAVIRVVDKKLTEAGATRIGECGEGDDDNSLEDDFLAWQENMWPAFCEALGVDETNAQSGPRQATFSVEELSEFDKDKIYFGELSEWLPKEAQIIYESKRPYNAPIKSRELFKNITDRHCLHIDIDISNTNLAYQTGDHVAIWPTNNEEEVERLAKVLGLSHKLDTVIHVKAIDAAASKKFPFPVPTTYRAVFRHYLDICAAVSRQTLMSLVEYAPTEKSKEALRQLATDKDEYRIKVSDVTRNLGEVLEQLASNNELEVEGSFKDVPFDLIVESVSRLQPRYYSISSSSKESPKVITATVVTLEYTPEAGSSRTVYGVNTNYLYRLHESLNQLPENTTLPRYSLTGPRDALYNSESNQARVPVHVRRSTFKLPRNPNIPVIMIGPGTGVAPFRGFVRERAIQKKEGKPIGPTILFFGCRNSSEDFLYSEEWPELFKELGEPSRLITAFSRETDKKVYVQHRLMENGQEMWDLIEKGAYIYVCGDAKSMARDVNHTFVNFAQKFGGFEDFKAQDYVKNLRNTGRYQEDVWS